MNITKEIAKSVLLAVGNYLHVGFAMIKSATIQWIGKFVPFLLSWFLMDFCKLGYLFI